MLELARLLLLLELALTWLLSAAVLLFRLALTWLLSPVELKSKARSRSHERESNVHRSSEDRKLAA